MRYYEMTLKFLVTDKMLEVTDLGDELSILANAHDLCVVGVGAQRGPLEEIDLDEARRRFEVPDDYPSSGPDAIKGRCVECGELVHWRDAEWVGDKLWHGECLIRSDQEEGISDGEE
jgi:hypothetical protein